MDWNELAGRVIAGHVVTWDEAFAIVNSPDEELLEVLVGAYKIRRHYHGNKVRVHQLRNAKSGACPEDCSFCSQSTKFETSVQRYKMQTVEDLVDGARTAYEAGAVTYCMVTSTRGPSQKELDAVMEATKQIKSQYPLKICASLGMLKEGQAEQLASAGVDRYNHNLETSSRHFSNVVSTHKFEDRVETVRRAKSAGLEACCGGIVGMGEEASDWVDLAFALRELEVESVPVNFLNPRPGTPFGDLEKLRPQDCLRVLAMFRFVHPEPDVRVAGGREVCLGAMQPLALYAANSLFINGYLTTPGQGQSQDALMIQQAGFEPEIVEC